MLLQRKTTFRPKTVLFSCVYVKYIIYYLTICFVYFFAVEIDIHLRHSSSCRIRMPECMTYNIFWNIKFAC